jgi:hypothetical protein
MKECFTWRKQRKEGRRERHHYLNEPGHEDDNAQQYASLNETALAIYGVAAVGVEQHPKY